MGEGIVVSESDASFDDILAAGATSDPHAPQAELPPEQSWLNESSQAPWPADLQTDDAEPDALTSTVAGLDDAANAHAFLNFTDGAHGLVRC